MDPVLYADFGYPCCYLAGRGVDALATAGVEVDWRAVEREPRPSVFMRAVGEAERELAGRELAAVARLLLAGADLASTMPGLVPNTQAAVAGYAEAYGAGVAADVRRLLLAVYWVEHADLGDPEVLRPRLAGPILRGHATSGPLREAGYAVSGNRGPITTGAWWRIRSWRAEWERLGTGVLPTLVENGQTRAGAAAVLRRLADRVVTLGAEVDPDLPDPGRYPPVRVRPSRQWVSQVGGAWARSWMRQSPVSTRHRGRVGTA